MNWDAEFDRRSKMSLSSFFKVMRGIDRLIPMPWLGLLLIRLLDGKETAASIRKRINEINRDWSEFCLAKRHGKIIE